jgi:D-alanyl-D-alanine carboxypeptidase
VHERQMRVRTLQMRFTEYFSVAMLGTVLVAGLGGCSGPGTARNDASPPISQAQLDERLAALQAQRPEVPGFAAALLRFDGLMVSAATGNADPAGRAMTAETPVRIASITKTFVAAAVLRLWEQELIDLDAPIGELISKDHDALLSSDGYQTQAITVRHLLMHAGGLADHAAGDAYFAIVIAEPQRVWTRTDQISVLVDTTDPIAPPGERFSYSDTGYLLLGEAIERITGQPLAAAVRELTRLDEIGLQNSWWDEVETRPAGVPDRAHQWLGGIDSYPIHGSVDAFGGGGLVASVEEVARFFAALFNGEVFADAATLALMTEAPGHPEGSPYRMGLFTREIDGHRIYGHGGFWGTDALVVPALGIALASVTLDQNAVDDIRALGGELVQTVAR